MRSAPPSSSFATGSTSAASSTSNANSDLARGAIRAMRAVVQVQAHGFDDEHIQSILDPHYLTTRSWAGSGFFIEIDGKPGYILTNAHVVRNAVNLQVLALPTSEHTFAAEIVGIVARQEPDIALIRLTDEALEEFMALTGGEVPSIEFGDSDSAHRGWDLKAIGYPFGMAEPNISGGEITNFVAGDELSAERMVTDAAINPGNSGGPAITRDGRAVGINTSIIVNADNIGFITPIRYAKLLLPQLLQGKDAKLAEVGARFQPNAAAIAEHLKTKEVTGVIVTRVRPGGMFDKAGLKRLDAVTQINDAHFDRFGVVVDLEAQRKRNVYDVVRRIEVGAPVRIHYVRDGQSHVVETEAVPAPDFGIDSHPLISRRRYIELQGMVLQELSYEIVAAISSQLPGNYWAEVEDRYGEHPKVAITFVMPGSPADDMFFSAGNVLTKVNGQTVHRLEDVLEAIREGSNGKTAKSGAVSVVLETQQDQLGVFRATTEELAALEIRNAVPDDLEKL